MMRGERGFALVITLIVTALLVALTVQFIDDVFVETNSAQNFIHGQQASLMANSGVAGAIALLKLSRMQHPDYTTLSDSWAIPVQVEDEKGSLKFTIEDETGRLNLNQVVGSNGLPNDFYFKAATRLFKKKELSLDLLDALSDWIDENDEPRSGGAETAYYMKLNQPYHAKNKNLGTLEELLLIRGFDFMRFSAIRPLVTVYPASGYAAPININTAPREVVAVLADEMTDELAKQIIDYRMTTPFKNSGALANVPGLESIASKLSGFTSVKSTLYRITSEARVGETVRTVEAVVDTQSPQPFLYWREY